MEQLRTQADNKPNKFVVFGTTGSMWDAFYELLDDASPLSQEDYEKYSALSEIIEGNATSQEQQDVKYLDELETRLSDHLGIPCKFNLIPHGKTQDEQTAILLQMANCVERNDTVSLDITHGLRHLPMLVVLSAMYLEVVKNVTINGIYYGAMEMKHLKGNEVAPALNLNGLLGIAKWVGALNSFDKDGDYGVFANLLEADGLTKKQTKHIKNAAFLERIFNVPQAAQKLAYFHENMSTELAGISSLFSDTLKDRTSWYTQGNLYVQQRHLAESALNKKEYYRAAVLAVEAFITRLCQLRFEQDVQGYQERFTAEQLFLNSNTKELRIKGQYITITEEERQAFRTAFQTHYGKCSYFRLLKKLRNTMAHSNEPEGHEVIEVMKSASNLESKLRNLMGKLFE